MEEKDTTKYLHDLEKEKLRRAEIKEMKLINRRNLTNRIIDLVINLCVRSK